jgi:hypothetical protein
LARLKEGAFGVAFEPLVAGAETGAGRHAEPARPDPAATAPAAAEARFEPVVQIDAAQPPLRLEIMGLAAVSTRATPSERQQGRMAETAP